MTAEELRQLGPDELRVKEKEMREQLARLRFQLAAGQTESVKKLRGLRKDIARLLSVRREHILRGTNGGKQEAPQAARRAGGERADGQDHRGQGPPPRPAPLLQAGGAGAQKVLRPRRAEPVPRE